MASTCGYMFLVITNKAGIGSGCYSEQQLHQLTSWMCKEFLNAGEPIDEVYFPKSLPTVGLGEYKKYDMSCNPLKGMNIQAEGEALPFLNCSRQLRAWQ